MKEDQVDVFQSYGLDCIGYRSLDAFSRDVFRRCDLGGGQDVGSLEVVFLIGQAHGDAALRFGLTRRAAVKLFEKEMPYLASADGMRLWYGADWREGSLCGSLLRGLKCMLNLFGSVVHMGWNLTLKTQG
jgi:hypothetical protein